MQSKILHYHAIIFFFYFSDMYVIEKIVDHRNINNVFEFKIRWEGYGEEDDTWEPSINIPDGDIIAGYFASLKPT